MDLSWHDKQVPPNDIHHQKLFAYRDKMIQESGIKEIGEKLKFLSDYQTAIEKFLERENYLDINEMTFGDLILSDKGKLMAELGGHDKYQKYRRSEINIIKNQGKVNNWLIVATVLAAIMPFLTALIFPAKIEVPKQTYETEVKIDSIWLHEKIRKIVQEELVKKDTLKK